MDAELNTPINDINRIIKMVVDVAEGDIVPQEAALAVNMPDGAFDNVFVREMGVRQVEDAIMTSGTEGLSDYALSENLVGISEHIAVYIKAYMGGEITSEKLVEGIGGSGIKDINAQILYTLGFHKKLGVKNPEDILRLAPVFLGFCASMAVYQAMMEKQGDPDIAAEEKSGIEEACRESVSMIRLYREEMEDIIYKYLSVRLRTFELAFSKVDKAFMDGDFDGYIKNNAEIQEILVLDYDDDFNDEEDRTSQWIQVMKSEYKE